jgi:hypothetical protein
MYHDGPATAYLSKAPDGINDLNDYEGEGDWFKIGVVGASDGMHWDYGRVNQVRGFLDVSFIFWLTIIVEIHHPEDYSSRQISHASRASKHTAMVQGN